MSEKEKYNKSNEKERNERLEPVSTYAIMAKLFAHVAKAVVDRFGEEGKKAVMEGVRTFGEERGREIARRAALAGKPNTIENYLPYYDMERSDRFEYTTEMHPTVIEQNFTRCAFADQWRKDGMEEYGILYCKMIDPAIARGFNPNFEVEHDKYLLKNDGSCHFLFKMKDDKAIQDG